MTVTCPWCNAIAPAGAAFCPNCGRQVAGAGVPGAPPQQQQPAPPPPPAPPPGPQWQQQSQWQQQPQWQSDQIWQAPQRSGPGCVPWAIGCAVLVALLFIGLVLVALIVGSSTPTHQQQRHPTTRRLTLHAGRTMPSPATNRPTIA